MTLTKPAYYFSLAALFILLLVIADICLGSVYIPVKSILYAIIGLEELKESWKVILFDIRIPRVLTTLVVGSGLSVSGLIMQSLFRNPLAGPYVLGISSGASLGVALTVLAGISLGLSVLDGVVTLLAAMLGSGLVFIIILIAANRVRSSISLLIIGLMTASITGAIVSVLQYFSKAEDIQLYLLWTFGNLSSTTYQDLQILIPLVFGGILLSWIYMKPLNAYLLGEEYATTLGINIKTFRRVIIISASIIAGSITAYCGPIAFLGIAVPHLTRLTIQSANHKILIPATALSGIILLLICDIISQLPGSSYTLPINAVTSLIGAPVIIWVVISKGKLNRSFA